MKVLILSDNHGHYELVHSIIDRFRPEVDYICHCGDSEFQADDPIWQEVDAYVAGNMDFDPAYPSQSLLDTDQGRILVVHGHRHQVNHHKYHLIEEAQTLGARMVFHGHTHKLYARIEEGILLVNPGSLAQSRGPVAERTFALAEIDSEQAMVHFYRYDGQELPQLTCMLDFSEGVSDD